MARSKFDETYVGGKPRPETGAPKAKRGRGTQKTPVVALVERGGKVRARKVERVDGATLKAAIRKHVDRSATIMTDEWKAYRGIGTEFDGGLAASSPRYPTNLDWNGLSLLRR